jgi:hypothetical protein
MDPHRASQPDEKASEHFGFSSHGDSNYSSVSRTESLGSSVGNSPELRVMGVNVPQLLTTLGLAGALIWHASVVTWRAAELSASVVELKTAVQLMREENREFQAEARKNGINVEQRLSRLEAAFDSHVRSR